MYLQYKQPFPWKKNYVKWIKHAILLESSIHMITRNLFIGIINPTQVLASADGYIIFRFPFRMYLLSSVSAVTVRNLKLSWL